MVLRFRRIGDDGVGDPAVIDHVGPLSSGVAGAPKFGDKAAWAPFIAKGMDDMVKKATQGVGAMPPKGGSTASDADFKAAIQYMVDAAK